MARASRLPQVSFRVSFEADRQRFVTRGGANWFAGAFLRWTPVRRICGQGARAEANQAILRARAQEKQVNAAVSLGARRAYLDLKSSQERIQVAEASVAEALENLRIVKNRYENGLSTVTELLRSETALADARIRRLAAVHDQRLPRPRWSWRQARCPRIQVSSTRSIMKITIVPLLFVLVVLAGCGRDTRHAETAPEGAPVPVKVVAVEAVEWPSTYEATGTVRAKTAAVLSSRVMGYVRQVNFQTGDRVRAGQLLVEVDSRDLDTQVRQAEAAHREAQEALGEVDGAIATAKAHLELAQASFRRMDDLYQKKSISPQEHDEATARLRVATAGYEMAAAKRKQVASKISQAAEGIKSAAIMREYTRLTAPFDGVVTEKHVEPGNLAAPGTPLATIEQEGSYRLEAAVEESRLRAIRPGQSVTAVVEALDRALEARVSEIVPAVDAASRTNIVKIDLPAVPQLRSGMYGRAMFTLGRRRVLVVPAEALREQGQLRSVFVAEGGRARARLVTVGEASQNRREVLSGLNEGEKIVFPAPPGLVDGARVEERP